MRRQLLAIAVLAGTPACTQTPTQTTLRALQSSGPVSFVCLGAPGGPLEDVARPLSECSPDRAEVPEDYRIPHLYALVTQPIVGEVAVVDLTTRANAVLDQDPAVPGSTFLPVGAVPTDIVSTPGSMATFVASAEPGFEAIFALPSDRIRGGTTRMTDWPICALPAAPGRMELVVDPPNEDGDVRPRCDAAHGADEQDEGCEDRDHCHGDLDHDARSADRPGRYKLLVTLPDEGGVAVIDAQDILDQPDGAFENCPIDRWLPLDVTLPPPQPAPPPSDDVCVPNQAEDDPLAQSFTPRPADLATDGQRLYVADEGAPVIHRLEMPTPCEPAEIDPLVATSEEDPERVVTTSRVAVSPKTLDLKQYVYAVDHLDGSIMIFDASEGSTSRTPISRPDPELNPFQPPDRIRLGAAPRDILIRQFQNDSPDAETGSTIPVQCDPEPGSDGPGTAYRTSAAYDAGARPRKLRGVFAFALLQSGDIVAIDVDDYDAPCRGPSDPHPLRGCGEPSGSNLATSDEYSCRAVSRHEPRAGAFLVTAEGVANNEPGITSFPVLFDPEGTVLGLDDPDADTLVPRMRAPTPSTTENLDFSLVVGSDVEALDPQSGLRTSSGGIDPTEHTLAMNLADPRAHILAQGWRVSFEGALPGFGSRFAELQDLGDGTFELRDATAAFCERGVRPQNAIEESLLADGVAADQAAERARRRADYVQIFSNLPVETDPHWAGQSACSFNQCQQTYGTTDAPLAARDFRIVEATPDRLSLVPRGGTAAEARAKCCFPGVIEFRVRGGNQWIVVGGEVGFLHHVTDSEEGTCRQSCDSSRQLLNGRVLEVEPGEPVSGDDPRVFRNPFFRFAISSPGSERGMRFEFATQNAFSPLVSSLTAALDTPDVQPTSARFLEPTGELVVSDGSLEGLVLLDLDNLVVTRQYN